MTQVLIIYNPTSGTLNRQKIDAVADLLKLGGCAVTIYGTRCAGDATAYLKGFDEPLDIVAVAGGDGTINEAINGMSGRDSKSYRLALIPTGTANVMAIELGYPRSAAALAQLILDAKETDYYLGRANNHRFALMVGVGYDAWVVGAMKPDMKKKLGRLAYVQAMLSQFMRYGTQAYRVCVDGDEYQACSVIVTRARHYGGRYTLSAQVSVDHPDLRVVLLRSRSRFTLLGFLLALAIGQAEKLRAVTALTAREVTVEEITGSNQQIQPEPTQVDGDAMLELPLLLRAEETPIRVLIP